MQPSRERQVSSHTAEMSRRVVALANVQMVRSDELDEAFTAAWKKLLAQEEITCAMTQEHFPPVLKPQAAILDVSVVRALSGRLDGSPNMSSSALCAQACTRPAGDQREGREDILVVVRSTRRSLLPVWARASRWQRQHAPEDRRGGRSLGQASV